MSETRTGDEPTRYDVVGALDAPGISISGVGCPATSLSSVALDAPGISISGVGCPATSLSSVAQNDESRLLIIGEPPAYKMHDGELLALADEAWETMWNEHITFRGQWTDSRKEFQRLEGESVTLYLMQMHLRMRSIKLERALAQITEPTRRGAPPAGKRSSS